jgi:uncharacterized protein (TIGR02145 family)
MNKEKIIQVLLFVVSGFIMLSTTNCSKDPGKPDNPTNGQSTAVFNSGLAYGAITDQDGNTYKTITIGTQTWMAENLRTTKYRNGEPITEVSDSLAWGKFRTGAYCNTIYCNNDIRMIATYGRLYNWYAVADPRNLAPSGWHIPTDDEWTELANYLGGPNVAGGKLKESGIMHWIYGFGATNETGFTALPGGHRSTNGFFYPPGYYGYWWSYTEVNVEEPLTWAMFYTNGELLNGPGEKGIGRSVRCIKD